MLTFVLKNRCTYSFQTDDSKILKKNKKKILLCYKEMLTSRLDGVWTTKPIKFGLHDLDAFERGGGG